MGKCSSQDLPPERVTQLSTDVAGLKKELREAARLETDEVKSRIKPNSAHKVYAWRGLLEEKELKSHSFSCIQVPSEVYLPDKTNQMIKVYHKSHENAGKVRNVSKTQKNNQVKFCHLKVNGYWQIPKLGPSMTRDK